MEDTAEYKTQADITRLARRHSSVIVCWHCKGEGVVQDRKFMGHTDGYVPTTETCPWCKGARVLRQVVEERYEQVK